MDELKNAMECLEKVKKGEPAGIYTAQILYTITKELLELRDECSLQKGNSGGPVDTEYRVLFRHEMREGFKAVADVLHAMEGMQEELGQSIKELRSKVKALEGKDGNTPR